jgi:hypothetical protein
MQQKIETQSVRRMPSQQMRAVLCLLNADPNLYQRVKPFIDLDRESIYWDQISKISFGSGHRGAVTLAYGIWTDEQKPRANVFDGALSMDARLQSAALRALAIRWSNFRCSVSFIVDGRTRSLFTILHAK